MAPSMYRTSLAPPVMLQAELQRLALADSILASRGMEAPTAPSQSQPLSEQLLQQEQPCQGASEATVGAATPPDAAAAAAGGAGAPTKPEEDKAAQSAGGQAARLSAPRDKAAPGKGVAKGSAAAGLSGVGTALVSRLAMLGRWVLRSMAALARVSTRGNIWLRSLGQ